VLKQGNFNVHMSLDGADDILAIHGEDCHFDFDHFVAHEELASTIIERADVIEDYWRIILV